MLYCAIFQSSNMPKSCYLCGKIEQQLDVFRCPKDPSIRTKWLAFCNIGKEYHSTMQTLRLCEKHFKEEEICRRKTPNGKTKLKKSAEPCQNRISLSRGRLRKKKRDIFSCQICASSGLLKSELPCPPSYFSFPKDPELRAKWLKFCEIDEEELPLSPRLCSLHFHPDEIIKRSPFRWDLASGAIPILYDIENIADFHGIKDDKQSAEDVEEVVIESSNLIEESSVEDLVEVEIVSDDNTSTEHLADGISANEPVTSSYNFKEKSIGDVVSFLFLLYIIWCSMNSTDHSKTSSANEDILHTPETNKRKLNTVSPRTPSPNSGSQKRKCSRTIRYLGDVREEDFLSPAKSKRIYEIATTAIDKYRKRSNLLTKKVRWLQKRVQIYRQIIADLNTRLILEEELLS